MKAIFSPAFGYIPEGAWNEPLTTESLPQASATGGGVSSIIPTPSWQTGTGVPTARSGRYTPDLAFSASAHDGYFACFAAGGNDCVSDSSGNYGFEYMYGTSAAAPGMAGITALLNEKFGDSQGTLNPQLYTMAAASPSSFHDTTVASSGVADCQLSVPSLCNNSVPGATAQAAAQPGFALTTGYDEVTGLGSLDVLNSFLNNYQAPPAIEVFANASGSFDFGPVPVGTPYTKQLGIRNSGAEALNPLTIAITGTNASDFSQTSNCESTLAAGASCNIQLTFKPSVLGTRSATLTLTSTNAANSPQTVPLTGTGSTTLITPLVGVLAPRSTITITQSLPIQVLILLPESGLPVPTGSVVLSSNGYNSGTVLLNNGNASITIAAGSLTLGNDVLTATYTPDSASASTFSSASGTESILVTPTAAETFQLVASAVNLQPGAAKNNTSNVSVAPVGGFTGNVTMSAAITSSPLGAQDPPTLSFGSTGTVNITGAAPETATLTITTTAPSSSASANSAHGQDPWNLVGGASFACLLLLGIPARLHRWRISPGACCCSLSHARRRNISLHWLRQVKLQSAATGQHRHHAGQLHSYGHRPVGNCQCNDQVHSHGSMSNQREIEGQAGIGTGPLELSQAWARISPPWKSFSTRPGSTRKSPTPSTSGTIAPCSPTQTAHRSGRNSHHKNSRGVKTPTTMPCRPLSAKPGACRAARPTASPAKPAS